MIGARALEGCSCKSSLRSDMVGCQNHGFRVCGTLSYGPYSNGDPEVLELSTAYQMTQRPGAVEVEQFSGLVIGGFPEIWGTLLGVHDYSILGSILGPLILGHFCVLDALCAPPQNDMIGTIKQDQDDVSFHVCFGNQSPNTLDQTLNSREKSDISGSRRVRPKADSSIV